MAKKRSKRKTTAASDAVNDKVSARGPTLADFAQQGPAAAAVKSRRRVVDPSANSTQELNNEFLDIWMQDVKSVLGTERLDRIGTAIPYIFNIAGDLLVNPSTVSPSTFKKMVESDYTIYPAMLNTINGIINTIENFTHPNEDIQEHIRFAITQNKRGWRNMLRDMLTSLYAGFSRQEAVWDYCPELGADIIIDTVPLPQNSLVFRVDAYGDLQEEGVGQYVFNSFFPGFSSLLSYGMGNVFAPLLGQNCNNYYPNTYSQGCNTGFTGVDPYASTGDLDTPYRTWTISPIGLIWIPTAKTIGLENYGVTNNKNPYGKALPRAIYNLWVFKYGVLQFLGEALDKKSCPLLLGYARPDVPTGPMNPNNPEQSLLQPSFQQGAPIQDATQYMAQALAQAKGSSAIVLAGMKGEVFDVQSVDIVGELGFFIDTLKYIDKCILMGLMTPESTFGTEGNSYSASYTQADVQASFRMSVRRDLIDSLRRQYVKPQIEEAFTPQEHKNDFGDFNVERTSIDDQVKLSGIYKDQSEKGFIDVTDLEDYNMVRENLGFKRREKVPEWVVRLKNNEADAAGKTAAAPAQKREKLDSTEKPYAHHQGK